MRAGNDGECPGNVIHQYMYMYTCYSAELVHTAQVAYVDTSLNVHNVCTPNSTSEHNDFV